jgi:hypothetical protein
MGGLGSATNACYSHRHHRQVSLVSHGVGHFGTPPSETPARLADPSTLYNIVQSIDTLVYLKGIDTTGEYPNGPMVYSGITVDE